MDHCCWCQCHMTFLFFYFVSLEIKTNAFRCGNIWFARLDESSPYVLLKLACARNASCRAYSYCLNRLVIGHRANPPCNRTLGGKIDLFLKNLAAWTIFCSSTNFTNDSIRVDHWVCFIVLRKKKSKRRGQLLVGQKKDYCRGSYSNGKRQLAALVHKRLWSGSIQLCSFLFRQKDRKHNRLMASVFFGLRKTKPILS